MSTNKCRGKKDGGNHHRHVVSQHRALALRFHPDKATEPRGQAACAAVFRVAAEANAVLTDVVKRAAYDALVVKTKLRASSR